MTIATVHPYHLGYSVLPRLRRVLPDDVFDVTQEELAVFRELKQSVRSSQVWHVEQDCPDRIKQAAADFIVRHYPIPLPPREMRPARLQELVFDIAEEVILHRLSGDRDWMALGYVFAPSHWLPEEKIGRSFQEIHEPVPGMDLSRSRKFVEAMIHGGPFERFVWGLQFDSRLNSHPRFPRQHFDPRDPVLFVKVERQVTVGLPEHDAVLFLLKQTLIPESAIDKPALLLALESMTSEQREYKGISGRYRELVQWLRIPPAGP